MNRIKAVQQALDGRVKRVYLKIGVEYGRAFGRISADEKIAVDPAFKLSARSRRLADAKARGTHYFETTSDAFFANETAFLEQHGIDVALIDGLHSYRQVVRDIENTLRYLRDDGVIVLHDCNPANASIACPAPSFAALRAQNHWWDFFQHLRPAEAARVRHLDVAGVRGRDQGRRVDGRGVLTPMIAGAAVAHSSGAGRRQQSAACQLWASARSASAPITGANTREYWNVRWLESM